MAYDADAPQPCIRAGDPDPGRFDHERGDLSPALAWDGAPDSTAGLVLLADDSGAPAEAMAGASGFGRPGYPGPAPPPGEDPHHYVSRLLTADEPVRLTGLPCIRTSRPPSPDTSSVGRQQTGGELNMQPPGVHIYTSWPCAGMRAHADERVIVDKT